MCMFKIKIEEKIKNYLELDSKPVLLLGARKVGKTTVVKNIRESFADYIYINIEIDTILMIL